MTSLIQPGYTGTMASVIMQYGLVWAIEQNIGLGFWEASKGQTIVEHRAEFDRSGILNQPSQDALIYLTAEDLKARASYYSGDFIGERHEAYSEKQFVLNSDGIAQFGIEGPMTKKLAMSASGTSTTYLKRIVNLAERDPDVKGGLIKIDSPGGSAAGTDDLAAALRSFAAKKPLYAFAEDWMASAAFWAAAACTKIYATQTTHAGSVGTILVIPDMSQMAKAAGVEVLVFTNDGADYKGAGTPGTAITDKHKAYFRQMVNGIQSHFTQGVKDGRKMSGDQVKALAGRVFISADALKLGLIDGICSYEECYDQLIGAVSGSTTHPVPAFAKQENKEKLMSEEINTANVGLIASTLAALGWGPKDAQASLPNPNASVNHNAILSAAASVGIKTDADVHTMSAQAEDAKFLRAQLLADTKEQAIRLAGPDKFESLMKGMDAMPSSYIVSQRDAFRAQANARVGITQESGAERTSAGGELPSAPKNAANAEQPDALKADEEEAKAARAAGVAYARQMAGLPPL